MDENMVMENTEVTEPEEAMVPEETAEDCGCTCESSNGFGSGMVGGAVATGLILGGIALVKKIKTKRAAKKAAKEAAESEDPTEGDTEE
jgi:hypothetical protein